MCIDMCFGGQSEVPSSTTPFIFVHILLMCMGVCLHVCLCTVCVPGAGRARRRCQIHWSWGCGWLWGAVWVLNWTGFSGKGAGAADGCAVPCEYWTEPVSLGKEPALFTSVYLFPDRSLISLELRIARLAIQLWGSPMLGLQISMGTPLLWPLWEFQFRSSCLCGRQFTNWAVFSAQIINI